MTESPHYTDHLIAALRCLNDDNLRKLAHEIMGRLAQNVLDDLIPGDGELPQEEWNGTTVTPMEDRWDYDHGPDHMREIIEA